MQTPDILSQADFMHHLPNSSSLPQIVEHHNRITLLIDKMSQNLHEAFKKKENDLLKNYKTEMMRAQRALRDLTHQSSENELRKDMIERNEALEKERSKYIQIAIDFTNHAKDLKQTLSQIKTNTQEIESEINFLNEQLIYAEKHSQTLQEEIEILDQERMINRLSQSPRKSVKPPQNYLNKPEFKIYKNIKSFAQMKVHKYSEAKKKQKSPPWNKNQKNQKVENNNLDLQLQLQKYKQINQKLSSLINHECFQQQPLERIFNETVTNIIQQKQVSDTKQLDYQNRKPKLLPKLDEEKSYTHSTFHTSVINYTTLSSENFNDYYKRKIFEEFLQNEDVKKSVFELLFDKKISIE